MFEKFFNSNNPYWNVSGHIFDLFILNVLWLLFCIPIVTIGPATTAMYYSTIQMVLKEETTPSKDFFRSFRLNLKQGFLIGIPITFFFFFLSLDIYLCYKTGKGIYTFFMVLFFVLLLFAAFTTLYIFPLLAKFEKNLLEFFTLSFSLSIRHLPKTLIMVFTVLIGGWIIHLLPGTVFLICGIVFYLNSRIIVKVLSNYLKLEHDENDEEGEELYEEI